MNETTVFEAVLAALASGDAFSAETTMKAFPEMGRAVDEKGWTLLHHAVSYGTVAGFDALLPWSDANAMDLNGGTPLMMAAALAEEPLIERVLQAGANPLAVDHAGYSALMYAASAASREAVALLAPLSDAAQATTHNGRDALMLAAMNGDEFAWENVQILLEASDPSKTDVEGHTALTLAARAGSDGSAEVIWEALPELQKQKQGPCAFALTKSPEHEGISWNMLDRFAVFAEEEAALAVFKRQGPQGRERMPRFAAIQESRELSRVVARSAEANGGESAQGPSNAIAASARRI